MMDNLDQTVVEIVNQWKKLLPTMPVPSEAEILQWLLRFEARAVRFGIAEAAGKLHRENGAMDPNHLRCYAIASMKRFDPMHGRKKVA